MSKRDLIQEITDRRARQKDSARFLSVLPRLIVTLNSATQFISPIKDATFQAELFRYIPISYVACLEAYFRRAVQDLIDFQDKYRQNVTKFKDITFRAESVLAIHGKTITVGEFIAYHLPMSSLDDINKNMSTILDEDFLALLRGDSLKLFAGLAWDDVVATVKEMFSIRHIYCHEVAKEPVMTNALAQRQGLCAWDFLHRAESVISRQAGPDPTRDEEHERALLVAESEAHDDNDLFR